MKILIQRSNHANVLVDNEEVGKIDSGMVIFACFENGDDNTSLENAIHKVLNLRIFEDPETKKMSRNIIDSQGQILCVSQFTLSWDGKKGHRPSFDRSMPPREAQLMYNLFCKKLNESVETQKGRFGADMKVNITNDGPVTFFLEF